MFSDQCEQGKGAASPKTWNKEFLEQETATRYEVQEAICYSSYKKDGKGIMIRAGKTLTQTTP